MSAPTPPPFAGSPDEASLVAPMLRVPGSSQDDLPRARSRTKAPAVHGPPDIGVGPPPASLDGLEEDNSPFGPPVPMDSRHNELDLGGLDDAGPLELDLDGPPQAAPLEDPGAFSPPAPAFDLATETDDDMDLPAPADMDLPAPRSRGGTGLASPFAAPKPPPRSAPKSPFDASPGSGELDLPIPSRRTGGFAPPPEIDLPAPAGISDLPQPAESNLMQPAGQQLTPAGQQLTPAGQQLTPGGQQLTPAGQQLTPAEQRLAPAALDVQPAGSTELAPGDLPRPKGGSELQPVSAAAGSPAPAAMSGAGVDMPAKARPQPTTGRSPTPFAEERPAVSKGLLIALGGIVVLGLAGAGVLYSGILDPDDPQPAGTRGQAGGDDGAQGEGALAAPSDAVLELLAKDTPRAYRAAFADAEAAGNVAGQAEALVLLAYRYGPDAATMNQAAPIVQRLSQSDAPHARRVLGLVALASGDLAKAEAALTGDDPRLRLYRGWLRLAQQRAADALAEGEAAAAANPDDVGALHLRLSAEAAENPTSALEGIVAALGEHPDHPALGMLGVQTALAAGQLAKARELSVDLEPGDALPGFRARMLKLQGELATQAGDHPGAVERYDQALQHAPEDLEIAIARVRALLGAGESGKAASAATELAREHTGNVELQLLDVEMAIATGEGDRALQQLGVVATKLPDDPRVPYLQAQVHAARLAVDEARPLFAKALTLDPTFWDAAIGEAVMLADARQTADALAIFDTARKAAADASDARAEAEILVAKAKVLRNAGQDRAAAEALSQAIAADPSDNAALVARGTYYLAQGERAKARDDLMKVFERTGGYPGLAAPLGRILLDEGKLDTLEALVESQLHGETTSAEILLIGAQLRMAQGEIDEAKELANFALTRDPNDWRGHMVLAQVLLVEGEYAEALAEVEAARPPEPEAELLLTYGRVLEYNGEHPKALPLYRKALDLDPKLHEARFLYARQLAYGGASPSAITEIETFIDEEDAKAAPWYPEAWLVLGRAQQERGKLDEAIASYEKAYDLSPEYAQAYVAAGTLYESQNKHAKAITALSKAIELGPEDAEWYVNALMDLGRAQHKGGQKAAAKKTFEKFLDVAPADHAGRAEAQRLVGA